MSVVDVDRADVDRASSKLFETALDYAASVADSTDLRRAALQYALAVLDYGALRNGGPDWDHAVRVLNVKIEVLK